MVINILEMQPQSEQRNTAYMRSHRQKTPGVADEPFGVRETRFPRANDIDKQTQELKALKLYGMNGDFRDYMFSSQPQLEEALSK